MPGSHKDLHDFQKSAVSRACYCVAMFLFHARLFRSSMGPDFFFMDDNAPPYRAAAVEGIFRTDDIQHIVWPGRSPLDLNPIEQYGTFYSDIWYQVTRQ